MSWTAESLLLEFLPPTSLYLPLWESSSTFLSSLSVTNWIVLSVKLFGVWLASQTYDWVPNTFKLLFWSTWWVTLRALYSLLCVGGLPLTTFLACSIGSKGCRRFGLTRSVLDLVWRPLWKQTGILLRFYDVLGFKNFWLFVHERSTDLTQDKSWFVALTLGLGVE